eukprot:c29548_g1_i1 orf=521-2167(-)
MDTSLKTGGVQEQKQAWGKKKIALNALFCLLVLTSLHILYVLRDEAFCETTQNCQSDFGKINFETLPPLSASYISSGLKPRYHFKSYEEYIQLQLNKTLNPKLRKLWTSRDWRRKVDVFSSIFQELVKKNILGAASKALCIGARVGQEVLALKEIGVQDATGIDLVPAPPLVVRGDIHKHPFKDNTFDFEFSNVFDHALFPAVFVSEIERTLKPGGHVVIHVSVKRRGDKYSANDLYSVDALISLFNNSDIVHIREVDGFGLDTEVVLRKRLPSQAGYHVLQNGKHDSFAYKGRDDRIIKFGTSKNCYVSKFKYKLVKYAEPLLDEEPKESWITSKHMKNIRYLPSFTDISNRGNYIYVDVGARGYDSSIGSWFKKDYPKQNHSFSIYAVEPDQSFAAEYAKLEDVKLLPYAAWVRNESLQIRVQNQGMLLKGGRTSGQIDIVVPGSLSSVLTEAAELRKVEGFDFAQWLKQTVSVNDYVVVKMDTEGTEFDLLPRMFETGAICLVDELFLQCHWKQTARGKTVKTYGDCLALLKAMRRSGVLAHQWW